MGSVTIKIPDGKGPHHLSLLCCPGAEHTEDVYKFLEVDFPTSIFTEELYYPCCKGVALQLIHLEHLLLVQSLFPCGFNMHSHCNEVNQLQYKSQRVHRVQQETASRSSLERRGHTSKTSVPLRSRSRCAKRVQSFSTSLEVKGVSLTKRRTSSLGRLCVENQPPNIAPQGRRSSLCE